jgi:ABC-type dipeptide/oligopeptide/nickel transport system ATPase component
LFRRWQLGPEPSRLVIVRLPDDLRRQGVALMFVTHNLGLVRRIAQHVAVLAGHGVRPAEEVLTRSLAPETAALIAALPSLAS